METYEAMRKFADSWGLLALFIFFLAVIVRVLLPGARERARDAADIPFRERADTGAEDR